MQLASNRAAWLPISATRGSAAPERARELAPFIEPCATFHRHHQMKTGPGFEAADDFGCARAKNETVSLVGNCHVIKNHIVHRRFGERLGNDENGHARGMVRPLDEGQSGDDLGRP